MIILEFMYLIFFTSIELQNMLQTKENKHTKSDIIFAIAWERGLSIYLNRNTGLIVVLIYFFFEWIYT